MDAVNLQGCWTNFPAGVKKAGHSYHVAGSWWQLQERRREQDALRRAREAARAARLLRQTLVERLADKIATQRDDDWFLFLMG